MTAERYAEILTEEGYPLGAIKMLWNGRRGSLAALVDSGEFPEIAEAAVRDTARIMRNAGWVEEYKRDHPEDEVW